MIKKIIINLVLIIAGGGLAWFFVTAKSLDQLAIASLFYPPLAYFIFKYFPVRTRQTVVANRSPDPASPVASSAPVTEVEEVVDTDKRAFLKLIAAAGLSYFIYSLFSRRPEAMFFDRAVESGTLTLTDSTGHKINPAERQPTDGYQISQIDEGEVIYSGFTNKSGGWYIMKGDMTTGSFRYVRGESNFPDSWSRRDQLGYDYFYNVFT